MRKERVEVRQEEGQAEDVTIVVPAASLEDFRLMLREQIAGDVESLRWLAEHGEAADRREPHLGADRLRARLRYLWDLAEDLGGLY